MAKNRFNHSWLHDHINDPYVKLAQREGYRAPGRLQAQGDRRAGQADSAGARSSSTSAPAPGSWSQYARNRLAALAARQDGEIERGGDRASTCCAMEPLADVTFIQGDFREESVFRRSSRRWSWPLPAAPGRPCYPRTWPPICPVCLQPIRPGSSIYAIWPSSSHRARPLKPEGIVAGKKCFHGSGYSQIVEKFKRQFKMVAKRKPKASRDKSSETFILGRYPKSVD